MTIVQTPNIPRVCVCSPSRSGSSMMMRVLQEGGLTIDTDGDSIDPVNSAMFREPYGMFEYTDGIAAGNFVNSFKLIKPAAFSTVPTDYKFIWAGRALAEIEASWDAIIAQYSLLPNVTQDNINQMGLNKTQAVNRYNAWQTILAANPTLFLQLDYDQTCQNPAAMAQSVANFIQSSQFPNFTFDQVAAAAAVDTNLYINRG